MGRKITIEPVTRIEGHGRVTIHLDDQGVVEKTFSTLTNSVVWKNSAKAVRIMKCRKLPAHMRNLPDQPSIGSFQSMRCDFSCGAYAHCQTIARIDAHGTDSSVTWYAFFPFGRAGSSVWL